MVWNPNPHNAEDLPHLESSTDPAGLDLYISRALAKAVGLRVDDLESITEGHIEKEKYLGSILIDLAQNIGNELKVQKFKRGTPQRIDSTSKRNIE
jgi:hypothetical protein